APVEVADDRVDADDRLALQGEDHAEDAVGRWVLRPHVHDEPLGAAVPVLEGGPLGGLGHEGYRSGENDAGTRSLDSITWRSEVARPTKACQPGSPRAARRTSARCWASR